MDLKEKKQYLEHNEAVIKHIEKYLKDTKINVYHELVSLDFHLDVYYIQHKDYEFSLLLTSGMSSIEMNTNELPENKDLLKFAELMVMIPKGIDFGKIYPSKTPYDWILSMIKQTAKFPHLYDTWIGIGHTVQANENMKPYSADTNFCGCLVLPTVSFPEEFTEIKTKNGVINIYGLFPLYKEEIEYKIKNGYNKFIQFLIENNTKEIIDFNRPNYCK